MTFSPWAEAPARNAVSFAALLRLAAREMRRQGSLGRSELELHFHVVDVTRTDKEPVELISALSQLLIGDAAKAAKARPCERLLFVGETSSLDQWEEETPLDRSAKKATEFYIRALCSAGVAHYGSVVTRHFASTPMKLASSAVLALADYYHGPGQPRTFPDAVAQLRSITRGILDHVRHHESNLVPPAISDRTLIDHIAVLFQLGRRDTDIIYPKLDEFARERQLWRSGTRPSAYSLRSAMVASVRESSPADGRCGSFEALALDLWRYELLRDIGRHIAAHPVRPHPMAEDGKAKAGGALIIDDGLFEWLEQGKPPSRDRFPERLEALLQLSGWAADCFVAHSRPNKRRAEESDPIAGLRMKARALADGRTKDVNPQTSEVVIVEVDSAHRDVGPEAVRRLWRVLSSNPEEKHVPPIIVLTRTESFGYVQQSLNLGAKAYVLKERIYRLPGEMSGALRAVRGYRDTTPTASAFRKLRVLPPEERAKLHRTGPIHFIRGGREDGCGRVTPDAREEAWLAALPKAELHCHMGGCVSLSAVQTLALNTVGHFLGRAKFQELSVDIKEVVIRTAFVVRLAEWLRLHFKDALPPLVLLAWAASVCVDKEDELRALPPIGIGDLLLEWIHGGSGRIQNFEVAALLVGFLAIRGPREAAADAKQPSPEQYLDGLIDSLKGADESSMLAAAGEAAAAQIRAIAKSWSGANARPDLKISRDASDQQLWKQLAKGFTERIGLAREVLEREYRAQGERLGGKRPASGDPMKPSVSAALGRLERTQEKLRVADFLSGEASIAQTLQRARNDGISAQVIEKLPGIGLDDCVTIPLASVPGEYRERGLRRYLWGSDLLGAENLQYPENLLIAAYALTLDNAADNVTYCEVRCETTGYCKAGMNALDATELLCRGFDVAAHYLNSCGKPLVRTNVLLAAKRHKNREAARRVVSLLEVFLERRASEGAGETDARLPAWWRPARVVGFDLSGDEAVDAPWLDEIIEPLARLSSPVTIHAGEAATAESVWRAVYRYHATRIGHGLRLREDNHLLGYCVDEGICMEMCPTSNSFTNAYQSNRDGTFPSATDNPRSAYPLYGFMRAGLEVAIGTDNRYLHPEGRRTLTSEYLTACRLSGGLTRWEVLQLLKSGFKNAFLPKAEVRELLSEMEERIYAIISKGSS